MLGRKESKKKNLAGRKVRNVWQEGNWNSVGKEIVNMVERKQRILWKVNGQYNKMYGEERANIVEKVSK